MMKSNLFPCSSTARAVLAAGIVAAACLRAFAGDADDKLAKSVIEPESDDSRIHALLQVELGDHYITPRGLDVVDKGLTVQPLVVIMFDLYKSKDGFLNDISLWGSLWNDWGTTPYPVKNSAPPGSKSGNWNEIDPAGGVEFKFAKGFDLNLAYTGFRSLTDSYLTSTNFDAKLTYHDSCMGPFSLNPSVEYFQELSNKATVAFNYATDGEGYYFSLGLDPTYKCDPIPLTIEIPSFVNIVSENFYQKFNGTGGGSGAAVISTGIKFSTPLTFIPKSYGSWTAYAGYEFYYLNNQGLLDGNLALTGKNHEEHDLSRFYGGISVFF
jgi:hypothetical protein